jgi:hypothetical protein
MMRNLPHALLIVLSLCAPALAEDPPMPRPRPVERLDTAPVPENKPEALQKIVAPEWTRGATASARSTAPELPKEPPKPLQRACPAVIAGTVVAKLLPPIAEGLCGVDSPLAVSAILIRGRIVEVAGDITTDCGMATALVDWVGQVDGYVTIMLKSPIASVDIGTSYMCRPVNNVAGGKLSFHGIADALDVIGFTLADGRKLTVTRDFRDMSSPEGKAMRFAHDAACGHFTTVLGPDANAEHADHLHIDLGCHGKTCTAQLCE